MDLVTRLSWLLVAALHAAPALVALRPQLVRTLYDIDPAGDLGTLIVHRGFLFLAVFVVAGLAAFDPQARRAAGIVCAISMIGFLIVYFQAGLPEGALRKIAVADLIGLAPLSVVLWTAWR